jgi:hypothetical protein
MGEREVTGEVTGEVPMPGRSDGAPGAGLRLVGDPVVDRAEGFSDDQSDTAELPSRIEIASALAGAGIDPVVARPGSGSAGWAGRVRAVLAGCGGPLVLVAAACAGPMYLFAGRVADSVVAAPVLSDLAGGVGLLLLPLMWLSYLALSALPVVLCLTGVVAVTVGWAADGSWPGPRAVLHSSVHRVGPLWAGLAGLDAAVQLLWLLPENAPEPVAGPLLAVLAAFVFAALAALMGMLGCVLLFERGRGVRRAGALLAAAPHGSVAALGAFGLALTELPTLADARWGAWAAALVVVPGALLWAVAALVTYAQARRLEGPLTSARLRADLAA